MLIDGVQNISVSGTTINEFPQMTDNEEITKRERREPEASTKRDRSEPGASHEARLKGVQRNNRTENDAMRRE